MSDYPTDIVLYSGRWARIHQGHGLDTAMLRADVDLNHGQRPDEALHVEEVWLHFQRRVKWCGNHGDACDSEGDWHSHWHEIRRNDNPETHFTLARFEPPAPSPVPHQETP